MTVLIHSFPGDVHADAVLWALSRSDMPCRFWPSQAFPARDGWTMEVDPGGALHHRVRTAGGAVSLEDISVVWNRRPRPPVLSAAIHKDDTDFATWESDAHMRSMAHTLAGEAFWINPPQAADRDIWKPQQLATALQCGLKVPPTLFSNDPDDVRDFHCRMDGDIVYKPYRGTTWKSETGDTGTVAAAFTSTVSAGDLENGATISAAPGIFQKRIDKAHEIRVTMMGRSYLASRIHSQETESARLDWRRGQHDLRIERIAIDADLEQACQAYMQKAGLVFGCFDFIVTPDGETVFLEINQMGQFLWQEHHLPDFPALQMFCDFVRSRNPAFEWRETTPSLTLAAYRRSGPVGRARPLKRAV